MKRFITIIILLLGAAQLFAEDDLKLHWRFDLPYRYNQVEPDSSGNGVDGRSVWAAVRALGGVQWRPGEGVFGGAAMLPEKSRGSITSYESISLPSEWSMSFWIKPTREQNMVHDLVRFMHPTEVDDKKRPKYIMDFRYHIDSYGMHLQPGEKRHGLHLGRHPKPPVGTWTHLCVIFGAESIRFYLNGVLAKEEKNKLGPWDSKLPFTVDITGRRGGPHNRFDGRFDDFRLYGRALKADEVAGLANAESELYKNEKLPAVPDPGLGYTAWLENGRATFTMQGREWLPGKNAGPTTFEWKILKQPKGASGRFKDPTDPKTTFIADAKGDYEFSLTASNEAGSVTRTVKGVVFVKDQPKAAPKLYTRDTTEFIKVPLFEPPSPERAKALAGKKMPLLGFWGFDEGEGNLAAARGEQATDLSIDPKKMKFAPDEGKHGGGLRLKNNAKLDFGEYPQLTKEWTLSFWVKSERNDNRGTLFRATGSEDKEPYYWNLKNGTNMSKHLGHSVLVWNWYKVVGDIKLQGQWNHIAISWRADGGLKKLYINGALIGTEKFVSLHDPKKGTPEGTPRLRFGGFTGLIDEVALYGSSLNNAEVAGIAERGVASITHRIEEDPYQSLRYTPDYIAKWFPDTVQPKYINKGFAEDRFGTETAPYIHPRLNFALEDLPRLRESYSTTQSGNKTFSFIRQYVDTTRHPERGFGQKGLIDEQGKYHSIITKRPADYKRSGHDILTFDVDNDNAATMVIESLQALIEADSKRARGLIDAMMANAKVQREIIDEQRDKDHNWQHVWHNVLNRRATPLMYDWLYNWMTPHERETIRGIIADSTAGIWAQGKYALPALGAHVSCWQSWMSGEQVIAYLSIYNEDGFDPEGYAQAARALSLISILSTDESGAPHEGMGKYTVGLGNVAVLSRAQKTGERLIASRMPYNHIAKFQFHNSVPWAGKRMTDGKLGGIGAIPAGPIDMMLYAYPNDPIINYLKHSTDTDDIKSYSRLLTTFSMDSWALGATMPQQWKGPKDLAEHLKYAAEKAGEPLSYFSNLRGAMINRSDWTPDAMQFYFHARSTRAGHAMPNRGAFKLNALGRPWIIHNGWGTDHESTFHNVVMVDGEGQDYTCGKVLSYKGAAESKGATFDIMQTELTDSYRQIDNFGKTLNDPLLHKRDDYPWMNLQTRNLVEWYFGDRPKLPFSKPEKAITPKHDFTYAYRTGIFARGAHPYALIIDDIKKDDTTRSYDWGVLMPTDIFETKSFELKGDTAIYTDPTDPTKHLMIKIFSYQGTGAFSAAMHKAKKGKAHLPRLSFSCTSNNPQFRAILYPYRDGDPMPKITGKDGNYTISIGKQMDNLKIAETKGNISKVKIKRK